MNVQHKKNKTENFVGIVLSMTIGAAYILNEMFQKQNEHIFDNITNLYILLIDPYISGTITAINIIVKRKKEILLLNIIDKIDKKFKTMSIKPPYKTITLLTWCIVTLIPAGMTSWAIHMYIIQTDAAVHFMWRMCFTPCYIMYLYFMTLYGGILIILYQRFYLLNHLIKSMGNAKIEIVLKLLPKTKLLHYLLCDASNKLTKLCNLPIILVAAKVYITTIACVLSFYGMVPQMHNELTVWMSVYWINFLVSVMLTEMINIEVIVFILKEEESQISLF